MSSGPETGPRNAGGLPAEIQQQVVEKGAEALEGLIPPELRDEAVKRLIDSLQIGVAMKQTAVSAEYRGIIPPPAMLAEFERTLPGLADRIMKMAEGSQQAEIDSVIDANRRTDRYQLLALGAGFVGLIIILGVAFLLAERGHDWVAGGVLGIGVSGIIATLVNAPFSWKSKQPEEPPAPAKGPPQITQQ